MSDASLIADVRERLRAAEAVTVLTGAGVSAESGIPTFRGADGYWNGLSVQQLASPEGFAADPARVWEWYNLRRQALLAVRPNPGHFALAELEKRFRRFGLITQNVDRLHQAAGSIRVVELHGNIWEVRCTGCERVFDKTGSALPAEPRCEACGDWLRPAVVWFGENLPPEALSQADEWAGGGGVFLVVGTSSVVWPAAGLAGLAHSAGATVIEINPDPCCDAAHIQLSGKSGEILPRLVE